MLEIFLYAFTSFFVIMDPVGVSPIYAGLTAHESPARARAMALRGVTAAFAILFLFGLFGQPLLQTLGISIDAFRIAGGIFLFTTAFQMVTSQTTVSRKAAAEEKAKNRPDFSIYPLAIPLLAGPGSMTTMILLMSMAEKVPHIIEYKMIVFGALILVLLIAALCLSFAVQMSRLIGQNGIVVFTRVLGVILAALSIQFIADGIRNIFLI